MDNPLWRSALEEARGAMNRAPTIGCCLMPVAFLISTLVDQSVLPEPGHHRAQPLTDLFQRMVRRLFPQLPEMRHAGAALGDPLLGKFSRLNVRQDFTHRLTHLGADDFFSAGEIAVLGGVA